MASKKIVTDEKPKATKKNFFRRSESVMPDNYSKNTASDSSNADAKSNDFDSKKVIRRSSMICSEGFDKYTFDCHRQQTPSKSAGLELESVDVPEVNVHNQNLPISESNDFPYAQSPKPVSGEQTAIKKISFKPPTALSIAATAKTAIIPFKRVPEETIPANMPLSYKRVPEETVPINKPVINTASGKSPATTIPLSFSPVPERTNWGVNPSAIKTSSIKSAPVTDTPFSFKNPSNKSAPVRNTPFSFRDTSGESAPVRNAPMTFKNISDDSAPVRNTPMTFKNISDESTSARSTPVSFKSGSDQSAPVRNTPLSFTNIPEKSRPVSKAFSFRDDLSTPIQNAPLSHKSVSQEFTPSRSTPLSFRHVPEQTSSSNYISDEPIPVRSTPLSLKGESVSLRNISSSLKHFNKESSTPIRNASSTLQTVVEEPTIIRDSSSSYKDVRDEPIPFRNSPLSLKPLTKHISFLKKNPSEKPIIKRDSIVHPERVDMQGSLLIDGRFQNPWPTWRPPTFANILKFGVTRNKSKVPPKQELDLILPIVKQNFSKLSVPDDGIRVTWIGHSTVLVQMHGLSILTDPIFSDRASPSQVVGPKRYRDPPCTIHDLPPINAVVISHSHYDHLDYNTITLLNARFGSEVRWFVPLGLQTWMQDVGCENVVELDWWKENCVPEHSDTFFIFTPAQHWSKRTIGDDNKVLWGSWCILGPKYKFFFAGDTGYCDVFKQIGKVHGPFDLSAIPIGAYEPRWFMKYQHVNPEEAVKIHIDVNSKKSLAIHWGTFSLANEYYLDPPVKLREGLDKYEITPEVFFTMKHGESRLIAQNNLVKKCSLSERNTNVS